MTGYSYRYAMAPAQFGGLKKVLRKALPIAAGAAAIATGNPGLAVAAHGAASAATKKKAKAPAVLPPDPLPEPRGLLDSLGPTERTTILVGGAVVTTLLLSRLLERRR